MRLPSVSRIRPFEKVNTGGVPLSVFELITATWAADGFNLRDDWFGGRGKGGRHARLSKKALLRDLQPTDFLQGVSLLHSFDKRTQDVAAGRSGKDATGVTAKREHIPGALRPRSRARRARSRAKRSPPATWPTACDLQGTADEVGLRIMAVSSAPTSTPTSARQHETPRDIWRRLSSRADLRFRRRSEHPCLVPKLKVASSNLVSRSRNSNG
jgi:hypothetical protein